MRRPGDGGKKSDPAGIAAHHLADEVPERDRVALGLAPADRDVDLAGVLVVALEVERILPQPARVWSRRHGGDVWGNPQATKPVLLLVREPGDGLILVLKEVVLRASPLGADVDSTIRNEVNVRGVAEIK